MKAEATGVESFRRFRETFTGALFDGRHRECTTSCVITGGSGNQAPCLHAQPVAVSKVKAGGGLQL